MNKLLSAITTAIIAVFTFLAVAAIVCVILAWPFMELWNYAVVSAFDFAQVLDYWHAFWLMLFISIFLKSATVRPS